MQRMEGLLAAREILIVDDETILRKRLASYLSKQGANCATAATFEEGKNLLKAMPFDFALLDVHLPDGVGLDLLEFAKGVVCIVMTADGGWELAVDAMKRGAADYIAKPFELQELPLVLARCANARRRDRSQQHRLEPTRAASDGDGIFFGESLDKLRAQLEKIMQADRALDARLPPVLIEGETGSGKSTIARWIHARGPRRDEELVVVNCAALPESLAESELFGYEKGAFTDAKETRLGLFEAADGGTLFLDEVASLSLPLQAKVLVAIEEGKIRRVGAARELSVDARLLAASNRDLKELVKEGAFREDLYHRLDLLHVSIPPLRERQQDILLLAEHLLSDLQQRYKVTDAALSERGEAQLLGYDWPGNVRELSHELERGLIMGNPQAMEFPSLEGLVSEQAAPLDESTWLNPRYTFPEAGFDLEDAIDQLLSKAISQCDGNVSKAARMLGVPRDYIRYRKKKQDS